MWGTGGLSLREHLFISFRDYDSAKDPYNK